MKKIIVGTQGNQPFEIKGSSVSRQHAQITIDDNGIWTLEDLKSTNGTFVRDENTGVLRKISAITIQPMTFICLGADNSLGCCFYAKQVLSYGKFSEELMYMRQRDEEFDSEQDKLRKKNSLINIVVRVGAALLVLGLSFLIIKDDSSIMTFVRMGLMGCAAYVVPLFYDVNKQKNQIKERQERFHQCPNPECSHVMSSKEIQNLYCSKCHAH